MCGNARGGGDTRQNTICYSLGGLTQLRGLLCSTFWRKEKSAKLIEVAHFSDLCSSTGWRAHIFTHAAFIWMRYFGVIVQLGHNRIKARHASYLSFSSTLCTDKWIPFIVYVFFFHYAPLKDVHWCIIVKLMQMTGRMRIFLLAE